MSQAIPPTPPNRGAEPPKPNGTRLIWKRPSWVGWLLILLLPLMLTARWIWRAGTQTPDEPFDVPYSQFYALIQDGKVRKIHFDGRHVECVLKAKEKIDGRQLDELASEMPPADDSLLPLLRQEHVEIRVAPGDDATGHDVLVSLLPWIVLFGASFWLSRPTRGATAFDSPMSDFLKSRTHRFERESEVKVTFDDVAGLKSAKNDLMEVVGFLKEPERFKRLGGKVPRGVLLVGPPGTGKTLLARAIAGESGVPFFSISASEFIEMFVGVGAARVRDLFEQAKSSAPSIVFIDELDAVGRSRGTGFGGGHDEREQTLNQLLYEMDGFTRNDLTIVVAATNRPDVLDPALLRPGRFDRRVVVDRPELEARRGILAVHTKHKPIGSDVSLEDLAQNTPGFSGADLANLVNEAALNATRRGADRIESDDFASAYDKIVLGDPRESRLDKKEKQRVAVHEAGHAVVAYFSANTEALRRVSIIPRGMALGATQQTPAADRHIMTQVELEARLSVLMGGHAAEQTVLGDVSSGAENDLKEATQLATRMVSNYGMSRALGPAYYEHGSEHPFLGNLVATESGASDSTVSTIEAEARALLVKALEKATSIIEEHRSEHRKLLEALLSVETIEKAEIDTLLGSRSPLGRASRVDVADERVLPLAHRPAASPE